MPAPTVKPVQIEVTSQPEVQKAREDYLAESERIRVQLIEEHLALTLADRNALRAQLAERERARLYRQTVLKIAAIICFMLIAV